MILLATSLSAADEAMWLGLFAALLPGERIAASVGAAEQTAVDVAIVANPPPGALRDLPNLRFVHSLWAGVEGLLADASVPDVPIARLVDPTLAQAMAEAVAMAVLYLHREVPMYVAQQRRREWRQHPARLAAERIVTLLGLGEMGRAAAKALLAQGFAVRGWSRSGTILPGVATFAGPEGLAAALDGSDILVNLLPLTPETRGLLDAATFRCLAPGAGVTNFGRGAHLVEADLAAALDTGHVAHAVLDVFATEPLPSEHPFWAHPGVTLLPHVAAPTSPRTAAALVATAIRTFRDTGRLPPAVNRARGY